jgi:tRNA 2-thiouridine synthesizing protein A
VLDAGSIPAGGTKFNDHITHMGYSKPPFAVMDAILPVPKNHPVQRIEGFGNATPVLAEPEQFNRLLAVSQRRTKLDFNKEFDASGLSCPLPIVKTKKALSDMTPGHVLRVISTDPGSVADMSAFAEQTGNPLLEQGSENGKFVFYIKKG